MQGELERALASICGEAIRLAAAGRTDAGVHATGQVISFRSATGLDAATIGRGVNALLPADIAVRGLDEADEAFHARFSATGRTYEYRIRNAPQREPLERHREHWLPQPLDIEAMRRATALLPGRHDLSAFALGPPRELSERRDQRLRLPGGWRAGERTIVRAEWLQEGTLLRSVIEADGFLRGMVRAIVGTLIWVGRGTITVERFSEVIASHDRTQAGPNAPPHGLCLVGVEYGGERRRDTADEEEG